MLFAHDTAVALETAAALVNTDQSDGDALADLAGLDRFVKDWGVTFSRRRDRAELEQVQALRSRLRRLWELDEDDLVAEVNSILENARALPQLVRHDGWDYHLHAKLPDATLADHMLVEAAMAIVDVVRQNELDRLRTCDADDCDDLLIDLSKNRSRRYCTATCSSRVRVR